MPFVPNNATEIRAADLTLASSPTSAELESIRNRVAVSGIALHPSGALLFEPFLHGPPPAAPPATGIHGGIDIRDAHSGRLRIYLAEPFAMLSTDTDGLHGHFLAIDENGQRLFALTTSGLMVLKLVSVQLGIGTLAPASGPSAGGITLTLSPQRISVRHHRPARRQIRARHLQGHEHPHPRRSRSLFPPPATRSHQP